MVREIFRYLLTAQFDEIEAAREMGIKPRFSIISPNDVAYLDARWSERGLNKPFSAAIDYDEIVYGGKRYYPDPTENHPRSLISKKRYLKLSRYSFWKSQTDIYEGDVTTSLNEENLHLHNGDRFTVHGESAQDALNLCNHEFREWHEEVSFEAGFKFWFQNEILQLSKRA